jgi:hypothetical protein
MPSAYRFDDRRLWSARSPDERAARSGTNRLPNLVNQAVVVD